MVFDQGTTSSRTIIFDGQGRQVSAAQLEFTQYYPQAGWVEHDPREIWASQLSTAREALARAGLSGAQISAIGIANQRETTMLWNRMTGEPIAPAIVWQCRRTAQLADEIAASPIAAHIRENTGLISDAYFSATKLMWLLENIPGARESAMRGDLAAGTVDSWLIWQLTHGQVHATDYTNASRTMLFDIHRLCWDEKILSALDIPRSILPEVLPSSCIFGESDPDLFGAPIPIAAAAGDQHAALFGQGCRSVGDVKNTYGTGCFLLMNTGETPVRSERGLISTVGFALRRPDNSEEVCYALEGSVFVAGAAIQWLRDELGLIPNAAASEQLARSVSDTAGAYLVPAFTGLGAPHWDQYARGTLVGLTRGCSRAHIVRAALESIAYQTLDVLRVMEADTGHRISQLRADGGASANDFLMQFQADILGAEVLRPAYVETTAFGAALLAGLSCGVWRSTAGLPSDPDAALFSPAIDPMHRERLIHGWQRALERSLGWAEN